MARRGYIGGGRQGFQINPIDFLRGGGGDNKDDVAMAMALMGYGKGTSPQDQALEAQKQAWAEKYQAGQLGIEELKQKAAEAEYKSLAEARTATTTGDIQKRMDEAQKEAQRKEEAAASLAASVAAKKQENAREVLKELLPYYAKDPKTGKIIDPEYAALRERATPGVGEELDQAKASLRNRQVQEGVAKYLSATPKDRETLTKGPGSAALGPPDVVSEILKQAGVQVPPAASAPAPAGGLSGGIPDVLWNLPGGVENIFRYGANLGSKAWYGKDAPQYEYMPWTHAADEWTKGAPSIAPAPVGPTPVPQYGNYGQPVVEAAPPEWQYGVGTLRPPPQPLNEILAKALQQ